MRVGQIMIHQKPRLFQGLLARVAAADVYLSRETHMPYIYITLLSLIATLQLQRESPTYILNEDTQLVIRAIAVSHTACKDEFRRKLRSHSWSVISFFIIYCT